MGIESILHIHLLGGFHLLYGEMHLARVLTPRLQALVAYLLLHHGEQVPRQRIAFLFWPDTSESQARTNLRHLLHSLRNVLPEAQAWLYIDAHVLAWNPGSACSLDVGEFEAAAAQHNSIEALQHAAGLYKGDLLPEVYDDWVLAERERLRTLYRHSLERLVDLQMEAGQFRAALQAAETLQRLDPLNEEACRRLMLLHGHLGERTALRQAYQDYATALQSELGIEPSSEMRQAYERGSQEPGALSRRPSAGRRTNLPAPPGRLIGRFSELEQVCQRVRAQRLVTLTGFGGIGKTRLALAAGQELAEEFPAGAWWIELSPVISSQLIPRTVMNALGLHDERSIPLLEMLIDHLHTRRLLLILDNCEHLLKGCAQFSAALLQSCPDLYILATSRVSLHLPAEVIYPVPPLPVPAETEAGDTPAEAGTGAGTNESERLFIERAGALQPGFSLTARERRVVRQICRRLDGIPLAIELAAAWVKVLSAEQIARRLDDAIRLLRQATQAVPQRHQTLQATLDWSYTLLSRPEQALLRSLAAFAGSFTLEAAEALAQSVPPTGRGAAPEAGLEQLSALVDHSLVISEDQTGERRFRLHEVTRQYALDLLTKASESDAVFSRHLHYYCRLAEQAEPLLRGPEQIDWLPRLDREVDNLRVALRWSLRQQDIQAVEMGVRLAGALWMYWFIRGRYIEGLRWTEAALKTAGDRLPPGGVVGKALNAAASFAYFQGNPRLATDYMLKSQAAFQETGDPAGLALARHHAGLLALLKGDQQAAEGLLYDGLEKARQINDPWLTALLLNDLGNLEISRARYSKAQSLFAEDLEVARQGGDRFGILYALANLSGVSLELGDLAYARLYNQESLVYACALGDQRGEAFCLDQDGKLAEREGHPAEAQMYWQAALAIYWEIRDLENVLEVLEHLARAVLEQGNAAHAARVLGVAQATRQRQELPARPEATARTLALADLLKERLGEPAFRLAWMEGQLMDLESMIEAILDTGELP